MGYDTSAVSVTERGYVVEGDILLRHEYLAELKTIEPTRQTQDVSRNVVSAEKRTINIVTSGVLDYYDAIQRLSITGTKRPNAPLLSLLPEQEKSSYRQNTIPITTILRSCSSLLRTFPAIRGVSSSI